jgi:hypothetical protein
MSFRNRHRFLDEVYNSYRDLSEVPAKILGYIAQAAGLSMEEILAWFEDEKERRTKFLASIQSAYDSTEHKPFISIGSSTITRLGSQKPPSSPSPFLKLEDKIRPSSTSPRHMSQTPIKEESQDSQYMKPKRQKAAAKYPCPDCGKTFAAGRWTEHMKRVHFPDQVWECSKINEKTGEICSRLSFRKDNFATHLEGEHGCVKSEISLLKSSCKFKVIELFHQRCGICEQILASRDESLEHIKDHFKDISESLKPPADLGASQWKERCGSDHNIQRGVHYAVGLIQDPLPPPVISHQDLFTTDPWAIENDGTLDLVSKEWVLGTAETSFADLLESSYINAASDFTTAQEWNREETYDAGPFSSSQVATASSNNPAPSQLWSPSSMMSSAPPTRTTYRCHIAGCGFKPSGKECYKASNLKRHQRTQHCRPPSIHSCNYPGCGSKFTRSDNLRHHQRIKYHLQGISSTDQQEHAWSSTNES